MSKFRSNPLSSVFLGVVLLAGVAYSVYTGEVHTSRYGSDTTSSDGPFFWLKMILMSGGGFFLLFSAFFTKEDLFGSQEQDEDADKFGPKPDEDEPDDVW